MKQRGKAEKVKKVKDNKDRWLITYADLITLLLVFFVVLYSLSVVDARKFRAIAQSLSSAMGGGQSVLNEPGASLAPGIPDTLMDDIDLEKELQEEKELERIRALLQEYIDQQGLSSKITVRLEERGVVVSFQEVALIPLGSAELTADARDKIGHIGRILLETTQYIRVEGHTDDLPINTSTFPSNWELSVARATSVVQELIKALDFPAYRLSATGYGEFRPKLPNTSEEQRQQNRRVDIVVLKSKYENAEPVF
ncbi:MAG: OmpA family protein [Peptococcaceae bacterium]|nr:OmpA family protein [Peptococcaceae bacterium]